MCLSGQACQRRATSCPGLSCHFSGVFKAGTQNSGHGLLRNGLVGKRRAVERPSSQAGVRVSHFITHSWFYYREIIKAGILLTGMIGSILYFGGSLLPVLFSSLCAAVLWWQMAFVAHDLGHTGVTHVRVLDYGFGIALANFTGGLSLGWWKHNHNSEVFWNAPVKDSTWS